jgi:hypothetical protein
LLLEPRTLERGYFNPQAMRRLIDEHSCGRRDHSSVLWLLLIFELWHRNFLEAQRKGEYSSRPPRTLNVSCLSAAQVRVNPQVFELARGISK